MPHGHCFLWRPDLLWSHVIADSVIALAYYSIPLALIYYSRRNSRLSPLGRIVIALFCLFIFFCGTTHLVAIWTIWNPDYQLAAIFKVLTAIISAITAVLIWPLIPKALQIPSQADVNALEKKSAALKESEKRFRLTLEAAPHPMIMVDETGAILVANKQMERTFGYSAKELARLNVDELVPKAKRQQHAIHRATFHENPTFRPMGKGIELTGVSKNGREFPVEIGLMPIETAEGLRIVSSILDVSERNEYIKSLGIANRKLQRSNRDLDEFAYVVSHDLRAPLRAIQNLAGWIAEDCADRLTENSLNDLKTLLNRADRAQDMIDGLLRLSQVGRNSHEVTLVDLNKLLTKIIEMITIPEGFQVQPLGDLPKLEARETLLQSVIQNLITNAINHHDKSQGKIEVFCETLKDHIQITIKDDGPGIPEDQLSKVFSPFKTIKKSPDGQVNGLGLAIVKKSVEREGGTISCHNNTDQAGAKFVFTWPLKVTSVEGGSPLA